jgi:hypothetical protein
MNNQVSGLVKYIFYKQAQYFAPQYPMHFHSIPYAYPVTSLPQQTQQKEGLGSKILNYALKRVVPAIGIFAFSHYLSKKIEETGTGNLTDAFKSMWGDIKKIFKGKGNK